LGAAIARRLGADGAVAAVGDLKGASALDLLTPQIPSGRRAGGC
jgi:hypothetical protein